MSRPTEYTRGYTASQHGLSMGNARASHIALLDHLTGPAHAAVLLHAPMEWKDLGFVFCSGCDYAGYECEPPVWPCRTIRLLKDSARAERRASS